MLNAPKQKLKEDLKAKEFVYKELDKDLNEILTTSRKDKSRYKQLLWAFTIVDQIIESKVWNEESINSMIEAYNYKLMDMGEEQKMFLKIMKQEMEEDEEDEITYKEANQEEWYVRLSECPSVLSAMTFVLDLVSSNFPSCNPKS